MLGPIETTGNKIFYVEIIAASKCYENNVVGSVVVSKNVG